jgi:chromosome partitioning protein
MGKIVAIANQKGGVGKTTTAINLAAGLGLLNKKVLLVDCDPQGNTSSGLGIRESEIELELYHALISNVKTKKLILKTDYPNLYLIPSTIDLVGAEIELVGLKDREYRMREVLKKVKKKFDYIIIDCLPSLGLLTVNALTAADSVIIPVQCEVYSLEGLSKLKRTIQMVQTTLNDGLKIEGILLSMYDKRLRMANILEQQIREMLDDRIFDTVIHRNSKIGEAPSVGKPVIVYDINSTGAKNFLNLSYEFLQNNHDAINIEEATLK